MEIKMSAFPGNKPGIAGKIQTAIGNFVTKDDMLVQVETGKGNRPVKAPADGVIRQIFFSEGDEIKPNQVLFELEENTANTTSSSETQASEKGSTAATPLETDLLVIGGGPGGYVAAIYAAKRGLKVILAEKETLGGTCLNVGCIPTKALVKSAKTCHQINRAAEFGILTEGKATVSMPKVIARKNQIRDTLVNGIHGLMESNQIHVIKGIASFLSEKTVSIKGDTNFEITAKNIIVATGSKVSKLPIPGLQFPFVMNSTQALSCEELPASITIIGGGVIGMEFAFIYRYFGVQVHVVEFMERILTMIDKDAADELTRKATEAGIHIHTGSKVKEIKKTIDNQAVVVYESANGEELLVSEKVLVAIGREPNLEALACENAGILLNEKERGIAVNKYMQTNHEHIYAIGDVTNIIQLAHAASHQGITAVKHILGEKVEMNYSAVPNVIFTSPEVASVGLTEEECVKKGLSYKISRFDYSANGKALTLGEPDGFIKLICSTEDNLLLGGTIIGADASSLIATVTLALEQKISVEQISETIFAHPTTAEIIHEAAMGLDIGALHQ